MKTMPLFSSNEQNCRSGIYVAWVVTIPPAGVDCCTLSQSSNRTLAFLWLSWKCYTRKANYWRNGWFHITVMLSRQIEVNWVFPIRFTFLLHFRFSLDRFLYLITPTQLYCLLYIYFLVLTWFFKLSIISFYTHLWSHYKSFIKLNCGRA